MNSITYPRRRTLMLSAVVQMSGAILVTAGLVGCSRRPIIVQAPPATIIQSPAPAPAPAPAAAPVLPAVGREVIFVKEAPPPPRQETPPPPPSTEYTWVPGYWSSRDGRQEWVNGHWEMPPRTGATWVSPRWERRGEGYVFMDGYWR